MNNPAAGSTVEPPAGDPISDDVAVLADTVAAVVLGCPAVAALSAGRYGEVATYLAGRQVAGVQVADDRIGVHVVGYYGPPVADIAAQIRAAVGLHTGRWRVDVTVDDLTDPDRTPAGVDDSTEIDKEWP